MSKENLSIEEKLFLIVGKDSMSITTANGKLKSAILGDGPLGLRTSLNARPDSPHFFNQATGKTELLVVPTAFPSVSLLCNTFNTSLSYEMASAIADDCIDNNVDVLLAPGINIKRRPTCGRNFEYFSEDPFLAGEMAYQYVLGLQNKGIGACIKHFAANNSEYDRNAISSEVDERTLREIYLPAFERAVMAKPWMAMCSYNPVNGIYASENKWLLKDILRDEFGFDGMIVSDWGAVHNPVRAVKASLDLIMPSSDLRRQQLREGYEKGELTEEDISQSALNIVKLVEKTNNDHKITDSDKKKRHEIARKIASEGFVLLKNDGLLPLSAKKILVAGYLAELPIFGGGGSSNVITDYKVEPLDELLRKALPDADISFDNQLGVDPFAPGLSVRFTPTLYRKMYNSDITLLCVGTNKLTEYEGGNRETLKLPAVIEDMIINASKATDNLVVLLYAGSAVDMSAWIDKVKTVLLVGFAGEGVNEALADVLTGKISPSGKLSETFPMSLSDSPTGNNTNGNGYVERYTEGVFVGYRWYDEYQKQVLFPFGFGLSYAQFCYSDLQVVKNGDLSYSVSYTIKNTSDFGAKEVSQVYVKDVFSTVSRPPKELKAFSKDFINAGESKRITVELDKRSFAFYSVPLKRWHVENGEFEIFVGGDSRNLPLKAKIYVESPDEQYTPPMQ